jgi:hypothetical protein
MLNMEIYKDLIGYENLYLISNKGKIVTKKTNRVRCAVTTPFGYKRVCLCSDGKCVSHHVHKLVALTFMPNPENKPCINHKNRNKIDNRVSNLEWCTHKENTKHMYLSKPTKRTGMTLDKANEVRNKYKEGGYRQVDLAGMFGISRSMVNGILNNYYWKK